MKVLTLLVADKELNVRKKRATPTSNPSAAETSTSQPSMEEGKRGKSSGLRKTCLGWEPEVIIGKGAGAGGTQGGR